MNHKLKEQLELVIIQCSALKAKLDEALTRNKQYEAEIKALHDEVNRLQTEPGLQEPPQSETPPIPASQAGIPAAEVITAAAEASCTDANDVCRPAEAAPPVPAESAAPCAEPNPPAAEETVHKDKEPEPPTEKPLAAAENSEPLRTPAKNPAADMQNFESILEAGADMVAQAVSISKEYIMRLETAHPEGCSSLVDIILSRTDLFKVEISGIIGGCGSTSDKREKMHSALIKLIQYFENVK